MNTRFLLHRVPVTLLLSALAALPLAADAQTYPSKPVRLIIPFPPGGPSDVTGRVLAEKLSIQTKQAVVIDNVAGASGNIGAQAAAKAPADGYTLFFGTGGTHGINPGLYDKPGYDPIEDFSAVAWVTTSPNVIVVHPSFPAKDVQGLISLAKASPGKFSSAAAGYGTTPHLAGELFKNAAGINIAHVSYRGSGPALTDLLGGHVPIMFDGIPSSVPHVKAGRLRALAVTGLQRSPSLPDVPTVAETIPGFDAVAWFAVFAPAGTPQPVIQILNREIDRVLENAEVKQRYAEFGAVTVGGSPEKLAAHVRSELTKWAKVIKQTGIKPQ